ncbi:MAG: sodium:proton antiporter, partial [Gammaproteobacteria bacterium]|nr:sodium:proton antiporter [Gammaproteobacteria bacterium]
MALAALILVVMAMLLVAMLVQRLTRPLGVPFSAALVLIGFAGAQTIVGMGIDTGLRWYHFHDLVFYVFLPVLIFESAFNIDPRLLRANLIPVLVLAIPLMLVSVLVTGALIYAGIGHPTGFPWLTALIAGTLLSATDPVAVLDLFKRAGAPARLTVLVEGESLFNDATTIVLYTLLIAAATATEGPGLTLSQGVLEFLTLFFGGAVVGALIGVVGMGLLRVFQGTVQQALLTVIAAYVSYLAAEAGLTVSGIMAVLVCGVLLGHEMRRPSADDAFVHTLWAFNAWIANALTFLLLGVTVTVAMFTERWLAMAIGIAAVLAVRTLGVYTALPAIGRLPRVEPAPPGYRPVLAWGGLRGAVTVALALALPLGLTGWWTVQSIAYGVVLFTL